MKVAVVGTGYVGLVTGTCLAETGNHVSCVDIDENKVTSLRAGKIPIYEPGLDVIFDRNQRQGRLLFTTNLIEGIQDADVIYLALPTPPNGDGSADLKYVLQVAKELGPLIQQYTVVVDKSTVPVGTAEKVTQAIKDNCNVEFDVVSNPEFLREGVAVNDFMKPDRVVIGTQSDRAKEVMERLYAPFVRQGNPIIYMDERSAELTKYAANAFLATKITFMNEIANLCDLIGADVDMIRKGIGTDSRIGKRFLFSGIGYGGSCFPKDVHALAKSSEQVAYDFQILNAVMSVNSKQKTRLLPTIEKYFNHDLAGKTFALWGLAFKPNTDDIREAPALDNVEALLANGAEVRAFDPEAMENVRAVIGDKITYCQDEYEVLKGSDALIILTEWPMFRAPDFKRIKELIAKPVIFDGRNLYKPDTMKSFGFDYFSIGRKAIIHGS